jgi:hypothetical protein
VTDHLAPADASAYRFNELGWLQFERLCSLLAAAESGRDELPWFGHADRLRAVVIEGSLELPTWGVRLGGRVVVLVAWFGHGRSPQTVPEQMVQWAWSAVATMDVGAVVVMTNVDAAIASVAFERVAAGRRLVVLGGRELGAGIDRHASVRVALPSVLGSRDLAGLVSPGVSGASSMHVEGAQALARVFWPTRAYERARQVVALHRFVVLTGPPEMGKTAIAQMLALAQLTDGWEAHECNSPEQLWRTFDVSRRQVFVADDAFGSTEYRPDAAERWAQSLGRLLASLDRDHWLIWTSRPAPLKAGLRRVQRERHAERFPSPGEVLVDASDLDLAEKTLILFRHAKARGLPEAARGLVRSSALTLVEHPHFTPERIRRLVTDRLDALQRTARVQGMTAVLVDLQREMSTPTEAMRNSYRALEREHRELLTALLDAPAGLIGERELATTVRRHHPAGLNRPPAELIDRLTDHFLRVTPLGIGWVHPSWRDLVITELQDDPQARQRFLASCGLYGVMLALSFEGGAAGERAMPLLASDHDWDVVGDRLVALTGEIEDHELAQLFLSLLGLRGSEISPGQGREARSLTAFALARVARRFDDEQRVLPGALLDHWFELRQWCAQAVAPPSLARTWLELSPGSAPAESLDRGDLARLDEWLALVQTLRAYDPAQLAEFGFLDREQEVLAQLVADLQRHATPETGPIIDGVLRRIRDLTTGSVATDAQDAIDAAADRQSDWFIPEDIDSPPSDERVSTQRGDFSRDDVDRVLADL